jgi:hypothetical protein
VVPPAEQLRTLRAVVAPGGAWAVADAAQHALAYRGDARPG